MFVLNGLAFIILQTQTVYILLAIFFLFFSFTNWPFLHLCTLKENFIFSNLTPGLIFMRVSSSQDIICWFLVLLTFDTAEDSLLLLQSFYTAQLDTSSAVAEMGDRGHNSAGCHSST